VQNQHKKYRVNPYLMRNQAVVTTRGMLFSLFEVSLKDEQLAALVWGRI
jgi:hypothetical protein